MALADRPGALGAVASRIGAVRGDVVGVEILERTGGRAIDEFLVELSDESHVALLASEIEEVDGVVVEAVRPLAGAGRDRRQEAYRGAASLLAETTPEGVLGVLAALARRDLVADWAAVVDAGGGERAILCADGRTPAGAWLVAHIARGTDPSDGGAVGDVAWAEMASWDLLLVAGRPGWIFAAGERRQLEALAALADARWADLARQRPGSSHPSCAS